MSQPWSHHSIRKENHIAVVVMTSNRKKLLLTTSDAIKDYTDIELKKFSRPSRNSAQIVFKDENINLYPNINLVKKTLDQ